MLNVCCVKWGSLYGPEYANYLHDMFLRNLARGFEGQFICFTDDPAGLDKRISIKALPEGLNSWWNKLYLFKKGVFAEGERILYFDLDTIFVGRLDEIVTYNGPLIMLRDFYRPNGLQSSVMAWEAGKFDRLWSDWESAGKPEISGGDQSWIEHVLSRIPIKPDIWQELFPGNFVSYKAHNCTNRFPRGAKIVVFHGRPRPHEVITGWVPRVWKVGGMTAMDLEMDRNAEQARLFANVKYCLRQDLAWLREMPTNDECAVICANEPSLYSCFEEIKGWQERGHMIFSVNGALMHLVAHGIYPGAHVLDEQETDIESIEKPPGTTYYVSSQLGPDVIHHVENCNVVIYHSAIDGMEEALKNDQRPRILIGGSTGCLRAMVIAYALGHRAMHLYGFDSSYSGPHHNALPGEDRAEWFINVRVGDSTFKTPAWMVTRAEEFVTMASKFVRLGCAITVHGDGLLQAIAQNMRL